MITQGGERLSTRSKLLLGGTGAIAPIVINLAMVDLNKLLLDITILAVVGYCIRVTVLFAAGAFVAVLNKAENDPFKVLQIGITAPALLTLVITGNQVPQPERPLAQEDKDGAAVTLSIDLISSAWAQPVQKGVKQFSLPKETAIQQVNRGLLGATPSNLWFVIASSHPNKDDAEKQAARFRGKGFSADVYAPYGNNSSYAVVIGAQMARSEAQQLQSKAIKSGLPKDTYLWTFPTK